MQVADLYIRVSTDEQADKGYSQRNQEEMLRKYCGLHTIQVRKVIYEDHSAKTFNRPNGRRCCWTSANIKEALTSYYSPSGTDLAETLGMPIK